VHALLSDPGGISTSGRGCMASPDPDYERFVARDYRGPCLLHCSPTSLQRLDTAFRTSTRRRLPQLTYFGAQSHSLHTRCLRFTTWVTPMLRKTRFRPVASLYRAGLATRWVPLQGFSNASSLLPPCPSFPGARGLKYVIYISGSPALGWCSDWGARTNFNKWRFACRIGFFIGA
jgi:hypothetical protein